VLIKYNYRNYYIVTTATYELIVAIIIIIIIIIIVIGKGVPLQAWSGPEGSRKLRFPDFITTAQDGGKVVSLTYRPPLPPGNIPNAPFC
jgi:hypothetical protein